LTALGRVLGLEATLAEATDAANRREVRTLASLVRRHLPCDGKAGILGLTYKPDTDVVEAAQGLLLARRLSKNGVPVIVYDPAGMKNARAQLANSVVFAASAEDCIRASDVVVLATPWDQFRSLSLESWRRPRAPRTVIDCWRVLEFANCGRVLNYIPLGIGVEPRSR
jgi:UDPglucose 6-dehydrogenase